MSSVQTCQESPPAISAPISSFTGTLSVKNALPAADEDASADFAGILEKLLRSRAAKVGNAGGNPPQGASEC